MKHSALIVLIVTVFVLSICEAGPYRCGPYSYYDSCGTACPRTCQDPNPGPFCPAVCVSGCQCIDGYFKRDDGMCVRFPNCRRWGGK